ncbi:GNAT family N-acetyltransferase [Phenylobacterium sp. LjRoot219]|uniref:GNAT family N-acetyltransferase n=1 Tax=Phenylobacterium sp. LjRoot219 TaxID=3342283 RepID=UPI003ECD8AB6
MKVDSAGDAGLIICVATSDAEREECCALRYRVYVEEQQRCSTIADHERRLDRSADDASGVFFAARVDGVLVGTVRVHHGATTDIPPFIRRTCMLPETDPLPTVAAIGKLAVDPAHRGNNTVVMLLRACHAWLNADGRATQQLFIVAFDIPKLLVLYRMLGFKPVEPMTSHMSEIGPVVPMVAMIGARRPESVPA